MPDKSRRILGIDPGLVHCGWGIISISGNKLSPVASGTIHPPANLSTAERLQILFAELSQAIALHQPQEAAVEESFLKNNAATAIKLGMARGIALLAPAQAGIPVTEYSARRIKQAVVGTGKADKTQMAYMIRALLPQCQADSEHAADALAVAICHAHSGKQFAVAS